MNKQRLVLIIACVCGLLAVVAFWHNSKGKGKEYSVVLVGKSEVPQGTILKAEMLALSPPVVLEDASDFFFSISDAVGMKTKQAIPAGKGVRRSFVQDPSEANTLGVAVPAGMIVVTFTSRDLETPPAFLSVGSYVDVLGYASKGAETQTMVVQSIQIVDMERNKDESFKSLSVAMTPLEAEAAAGATKLGQIRLALRLEPLIKSPQPYVTTPMASVAKSMEVIRGASPPVRTVFGTSESAADSIADGGVYPGQSSGYSDTRSGLAPSVPPSPTASGKSTTGKKGK